VAEQELDRIQVPPLGGEREERAAVGVAAVDVQPVDQQELNQWELTLGSRRFKSSEESHCLHEPLIPRWQVLAAVFPQGIVGHGQHPLLQPLPG
jgi:hypothetical protein